MAVESKAEASGAGPEAIWPPRLDADLVNAYLELQVSWLKLQLDNAHRQAEGGEAEADQAASTSRLLRQAAPTAVIIALLSGAVGLLIALTWDDLWRGVATSYAMIGTPEEAARRMGAAGNFLKDWKDFLLGLAGGSAFLTFKRLAYRSIGGALVISLSVVLAAALFAGLVVADMHLVQEDMTPPHVTWRGWGVLVVAVVVGLALIREIADIATAAGPEAFHSRSHWYDGIRNGFGWITSSTPPGRFVCWLVTPRRWRRLFAILGTLTAISVGLCAVFGAALLVTRNPAFWIGVLVAFPLGPAWWLWLLTVVLASPAIRRPADGGVRLAVFTLASTTSVVAVMGSFLANASYDSSGTLVGVAPWVLLVGVLTWGFWFIWAGVALPTSLRITFLPFLIVFIIGGFMHYGTLPFLLAASVISAGVPISLWRHHAAGTRVPARTVAAPVQVRA